MPGRRVPTRRNVSSTGGAAPAFGVLSVEPSTLVFSGVAGADAFVPEDIMQAYNSGAGPWSGAPSIGIAYDVTPDWLTLTPEAGVDGVIRYTITVDTTILAAGTEVATVTFTDTLCSNSPRVATVTVVVEADDPTIGLSQSLFSASVPAGDVGVEQTVTITNVGGGVLATPTIGTVTGTGASYVGTPAITGSGPWTLTFTPTATSASAGAYQAVIPVASVGANNTPQNVTVDLTVTAAGSAIIGLPSSGQEAKYIVGSSNEPTSQVFIVQNNGTEAFAGLQANIAYSGESSGWLSASFIGQEVTLAFDCEPNVVSEGVSYATVTFSDANAVSPATYVVDLYTSAATLVPNITATPASVSRIYSTGATPPAQPVTVGNSTGSIADLGTITASLTTATTWVTVSYASGTATISFPGASALAAGTYSANVRIAGSQAGNSHVDVPITLIAQTPTTVPLLLYTLPGGVTQNATTGYCEGVPTGVLVTPPSGWDAAATHSPITAAAFQTALNQSALAANANGAGNVIIEMDPNVTYVSTNPFTVPATVDRTGWLIIRPTTHGSLNLTRGVRIGDTPAIEANLFTLQSPNATEMLRIGDNCTKVWIIGMKTTDVLPANVNFNHVTVRPNTYSSNQSPVPQDIYFDHCWFKGNTRPEGGSIRGVYWTAFRTAIMDCRFTDFRKGRYPSTSSAQEAQAVYTPQGGQYYYLYNNFMEAAGESYMTGGVALAGQDPSLNPRDVYIKQCVLTGRLTWCKTHPSYLGFDFAHKNVFEVKRGIRILVDGCIFKDGFTDDQAGIQIVIKSTNQSSDNLNSWSDDIQLIHCWGYSLQRTFNVIGNPPNDLNAVPPVIRQSKQNDRTHILECLFERINLPGLSPTGSGFLMETANNVTNTTFERITTVLAGGLTPTGCILTYAATGINVVDNIFPQGNYGIDGDGANEGTASINKWWTNSQVTRNTFYAGGNIGASSYPAGNDFPSAVSAIGFVNPTGSTPLDYDFLPSSPYYGDGIEPTRGCNVKRVYYKTDGVLVGTPVNS